MHGTSDGSRTAVVDASVIVELFVSPSRADAVRASLAGLRAIAPVHMDAEVLGGLFRAARRGLLDAEQAPALLAQLVELPIERVPLAGLVGYAWPLRHNVSANDALYVALARQFGCPLITADRRLAGAPDLGVPITVIS